MPLSTTTSSKTMILNLFYIPCTPLLTTLSIPVEQIFILSVLLMIDYCSGIVKVFILKGSIKSYRAIAGLLTKVSVLFLILALALMAKGLNLDFTIYLGLLLSALIIAETYSITGNIYSIVTKKDVEESDALSNIMKGVRTMIESVLITKRDGL